MKFEELYIGLGASLKKVFRLEDVEKFAVLSEDMNPIHLSEEFSANTPYKRPIVHGFLYGSMISSILANQVPGPGSIYLYQELNFKAPVFHGDEVIATVKIFELRLDKRIIKLDTFCHNSLGIEVLSGVAIIKLLENE
jgi:acyl dehydratase